MQKIDITKLSSEDKLNFTLMKEKLDYYEIVPYEKIKKKASLSIECEGKWRDAREKSNFNIVKKSFKKLVNVIREEAETLSQEKNKNRYDCLLNNYDRSL